MKKSFPLLTLILLVSCAKEADVPVQLEQPVQEALTYTLSVPAGKDTKALNIDGTALKATWAEGETVRVFRGELLLGTLTAQTAGQSTTLTGEIKGEIKDDDKFTLRFLSPSYASQDGTLNYIATHCDYAVANVTVSKIVGSAVTTTQASFQNQQAIVKFDLRNADNTADISASALMITLPDQVIRVTPASAQSEFYVAVPALSSQSISLKALVEDEVFMLNKSGVSLSAGSYYNITAKLSKTDIVLVHNESELTAAVLTGGAQILFANDIAITKLLEITGNRTVTIDMDGYKLDRGCTSRGSQAIVVRNGSTLNLNNGTVTGGWGGNGGALDIETNSTVNLNNVIISDNYADDRGGGIANKGMLTMTGGAITNNTCHDHEGPRGGGGLFNHSGATATLTNVSFSGNRATVTGGGGICNYGTLTLDSCTITGNSGMMNGGGIWQGAEATLNLQGKTTVIDNTSDGDLPSDFFLKTNAVITVTGSLAGSSVGVQMENNTGTFTSAFGTHNSGVDPATLFFSNLPETYQVAAAEDEAKVDVLTTLHYIACSWDDVNKQVVKTQKTLSNCIPLGSIPESEADYKVITGGSGEFGMGGMTGSYPEFFVVRGTVNRDAIRVNGTDVHLVLCDGATLNVNSIIVNPAYKLYIHVQSYGPSMGKLHADNNGHQETAAGIGSESGLSHAPNLDGPGLIEIHGGTIYAKGGDNGAGIGGGDWAKGGNIVIYGGDIRAYGGDGGGIDGSAGAGIGGGNLAEGPINFTVYGGTVYAYGGPDAAGIGSGNCGNNFDYTIHHGGYFTMYGGYVEAHGADNGAGIGGGEYSEGPKGVNIYGGSVKAYGGDDAAGIGGGYHWAKDLSSGTIHISGGEVYAWGKSEGAGIGGGENGKGADVTISGGIVEAHAGENEVSYRAIGPGRDNSNYGSLNLGDQMMVRYKIGNNWSEPVPVAYEYGRKAGAWYHTEARIEPCTHPGYNASNCPYHVHP